MPSERTPLLREPPNRDQFNITNSTTTLAKNGSGSGSISVPVDPHDQFCMLIGVPSSAPTPDGKPRSSTKSIPRKSLYGRATRQLSSQRLTYYGTASLSNTMLLSQVVLGAALTALGASESSHILITIFGAMNTVIAGLVAYLKSRGQPMRSRMYRDDLERVVDEIENSEVMWLGISRGVHGYEDIDTGSNNKHDGKGEERNPNAVTVRSEVARLTRLYDRAVRNNTVNNPDMYMTGNVDGGSGGASLRRLPVPGPAAPSTVSTTAPAVTPSVPASAIQASPVQEAHDPDESPATALPKPKEESKKAEDMKPKEEVKKEEGEESKGKVNADVPPAGDSGGKTTSADSSKDNKGSSAPASTPAPAPPSAAAAPASTSSAPAPASATVPTDTTKQQGTPVNDPDAEPASDSGSSDRKVPGDDS